jgi:hypothetical protein
MASGEYMTKRDRQVLREFVNSESGRRFLLELKLNHPKPQGASDMELVRGASIFAGWQQCIERVEQLAEKEQKKEDDASAAEPLEGDFPR